jgi:hypothetical protein
VFIFIGFLFVVVVAIFLPFFFIIIYFCVSLSRADRIGTTSSVSAHQFLPPFFFVVGRFIQIGGSLPLR